MQKLNDINEIFPVESFSPIKPFQNYHSELPSIEESQQDYQKFYSDHILYVTEVPFLQGNEVTNEPAKSVKILSCNVMENDAFNGAAPLGQTSYGETQEQKEARHATRIAESIQKAKDKENPDFITLQEITNYDGPEEYKTSLLAKIREKLGENWKITIIQYEAYGELAKELIDYKGNIVFYDETVWEPAIAQQYSQQEKRNLSKKSQSEELFASITTYKLIQKPDKKVCILNAHTHFKYLPTYHEKHIANFLTEKTNKNTSENENSVDVAVAIGDFNCTVLPADFLVEEQPNLRNITTNIGPNVFRNYKRQGAYAIDGCFYGRYNEASQNVEMHHAEIIPLSFKTGERCNPELLEPFSKDDLNAHQFDEINEFRMGICLDHRLKDYKLGEKTLKEHQDFLRKKFNNENIHIEFAVNLNNEPGLAIAIPRELYYLLKSPAFSFTSNLNLQYSVKYSTNNSAEKMLYFVAAPINSANFLLSLLQEIKPEDIIKANPYLHFLFESIQVEVNAVRGEGDLKLKVKLLELYIQLEGALNSSEEKQKYGIYQEICLQVAQLANYFYSVKDKPEDVPFKEIISLFNSIQKNLKKGVNQEVKIALEEFSETVCSLLPKYRGFRSNNQLTNNGRIATICSSLNLLDETENALAREIDRLFRECYRQEKRKPAQVTILAEDSPLAESKDFKDVELELTQLVARIKNKDVNISDTSSIIEKSAKNGDKQGKLQAIQTFFEKMSANRLIKQSKGKKLLKIIAAIAITAIFTVLGAVAGALILGLPTHGVGAIYGAIKGGCIGAKLGAKIALAAGIMVGGGVIGACISNAAFFQSTPLEKTMSLANKMIEAEQQEINLLAAPRSN